VRRKIAYIVRPVGLCVCRSAIATKCIRTVGATMTRPAAAKTLHDVRVSSSASTTSSVGIWTIRSTMTCAAAPEALHALEQDR
jgi:hypothetical protein